MLPAHTKLIFPRLLKKTIQLILCFATTKLTVKYLSALKSQPHLRSFSLVVSDLHLTMVTKAMYGNMGQWCIVGEKKHLAPELAVYSSDVLLLLLTIQMGKEAVAQRCVWLGRVKPSQYSWLWTVSVLASAPFGHKNIFPRESATHLVLKGWQLLLVDSGGKNKRKAKLFKSWRKEKHACLNMTIQGQVRVK